MGRNTGLYSKRNLHKSPATSISTGFSSRKKNIERLLLGPGKAQTSSSAQNPRCPPPITVSCGGGGGKTAGAGS
jgi:hypothetical protein